MRRLLLIFTVLTAMMCRAGEPIFFDRYVVLDGDTIDITALYQYKMREQMEQNMAQYPAYMRMLMQPIDWPRTLTTLGISVGLKLAVDHTLKHTVDEMRPDGSDSHSFPSRHATWAYGIGAKLSYITAQYSPWWTFGVHTLANGVGMQRVMHRRHYPHDVLAGAAIGIGTDLVSRVIGNWIFGTEPLFPGWRQCVNANAGYLSMSTGATLPLQRTYGDYRLGTSLRASLGNATPLSQHWAIASDISLESGFIKDADDYAHVTNALSAKVGAMVHTDFGGSPSGLSATALLGYKRYFNVKGLDVKDGSFIGEMQLQYSAMLTRKLAIGAYGACSLSSFGIEGCDRTLTAFSVGFLSKAYF